MNEGVAWVFTFHYVSIKSPFKQAQLYLPHIFTFHYVSIKSNPMIKIFHLVWYLHSTMYLLNRYTHHHLICQRINLHSTMYLLNQLRRVMRAFWLRTFTFHYVSIKSIAAVTDNKDGIFTFHYVSIKSWRELELSNIVRSFTFHYVSIKSISPFLNFCIADIYIPLCIY